MTADKFEVDTHIKCLYWDTFCDSWQTRDIRANVVVDNYHDAHVDAISYFFKRIFTNEETYCVKSKFPLVDISGTCTCVYYLNGQEKDAVTKLSGRIYFIAVELRNQSFFYDLIREKLED